ncbi:MAG TPA: ABC transporter substrate-binding protein [Flavobacteriales bacterium]|nr:ABC transporter substrate-binding protein [Flavobacteriales bacterium]
MHITNDFSGFRSFVYEYIHKPLIRTDLRTLKMANVLCIGDPVLDETGTRLTYTLRNDIKWDNGEPFTVEDVVFSVKLILSPLTHNPQAKSNFTNSIQSIETFPGDQYSFVLVSPAPLRGNKEVMSEVYFVQQSIWDPKDVLAELKFEDCYNEKFVPTDRLKKWFEEFNAPNRSKNPEYLTGLGPYKLIEWVDDSYILLEKKKNWWGDSDTSILLQNNPDKIIFKIIKDESATYFAIRNENIDAVNRLGMTKLIKLQKHEYFNASYQSAFIDQYAYNYLGMNMRPDGITHLPFFTDVRVRRAIAHLVPADDIIKVMYKGKAGRQVSFLSSLKQEYAHDIPLVEWNKEAAERLLDEAGWKDTDGDNIRDKVINGEKVPFRFRLNYMSDAAPSKEICLMIKENLYKAGLDVIPNPLEFSLFYEKAFTHDFDALMGAWMGSALYEDPSQLWHSSQWSNFGANFCGFGNAKSDSLIDACNREMNDSLYVVKIRELQKMVADEQPYVFLCSPQARVAIHRRFAAGIYSEKPQMFVNEFQLLSGGGGTAIKPDLTQ